MSDNASYDGPIIDAFLHGPWIGTPSGPEVRADRVEWIADRRLRRVMRTFKHDKGAESGADTLAIPDLLAAMDGAGVERGILATKVYYTAPADSVKALNRQFAAMAAESGGRLKWIASLIPPDLGQHTDAVLRSIGLDPAAMAIAPADRQDDQARAL